MSKPGEIKKAKEIGKKAHNKYIFAACQECSKERWVQIRNGKAKSSLCRPCRNLMFNSTQTGSGNPHWKGGITTGKGGIKLLVPNHPRADVDGYVFEHRLVAEKALGRILGGREIVHHINGNNRDNRNFNLLVCDRKYHQILHKRIRQLGPQGGK